MPEQRPPQPVVCSPAQPGITGMSFTRNWVLETITWSPAFSPEEME